MSRRIRMPKWKELSINKMMQMLGFRAKWQQRKLLLRSRRRILT